MLSLERNTDVVVINSVQSVGGRKNGLDVLCDYHFKVRNILGNVAKTTFCGQLCTLKFHKAKGPAAVDKQSHTACCRISKDYSDYSTSSI